MKKQIFLILFLQNILSIDFDCVPKNILITLGDYFSNEESENIYRVSFMQRNQDCKEKLILKVFYDDHEQEFEQKDQRKYDFVGKSWQTDVDYHRQFGMFELNSLQDPLKFTYGIYIENRMLAGPFFFESKVADNNLKNYRFVTFGDHDLDVGIATLDRLKHEKYDMIILLGDYAYDIEEDNGQKGDYYFSQMQDIFSTVPTILVPGNHEYLDQTKFFTSRFWFPGTKTALDNNFYAFAIQDNFFLAYNTEYMILFPEQEIEILKNIEGFLKHSKNFKFKFLINHRPLICTQLYWETKECQLTILYQKSLSDLLVKYNVDIILSGHIHDYERLSNQNSLQSKQKSYKQFIIGSGGSEHSFGPIPEQPRQFLEKQIMNTVGYGLIEMTEYKFYFQFIESYNNNILDQFEIDKTPHTNIGKFLTIFFITFVFIFLVIFFFMKKYDSNNVYTTP